MYRKLRGKLLALFLSVAMIFTMGAPLSAFATDSAVTKVENVKKPPLRAVTNWYYDHEGDASYTLNNNEDIQGLEGIVNSGIYDFDGKTIILGNDISNLITPPIGTKENPFAGTFDGKDKTITNLQITPATTSYIGLFGHTAPGSVIKNLNLSGGTLTVSQTGDTGVQIRYVGTIAGYAEGDIENCSSSMDIKITNDTPMGENMGIIRNVGGLAGFILGDMRDCAHSGDIWMTSSSNITEEVKFLAGEIGGLSGAQGDVDVADTLPVTENCVNSGDFLFSFKGVGGKDRFGEDKYPVSFAAGGIVGQASGIIRGCRNSGVINTSNRVYDEKLESEGPEAGYGADKTGGIVGDLRGDTFEIVNETSMGNSSETNPGFTHFKKKGGVAEAPDSYPSIAAIYDCVNTGEVDGLAAVGGIVGSTGAFIEIEGCSNTGDVKGCRWNKPFAGGIGGKVQGDVRYCFNRGDIYSVAGAGYYCTGLVSGLWSLNNSLTPDNEVVPVIEMAGCYTVGIIYTSAPGFRTSALVGENDGYVHDNVYNIEAMDSNVVYADGGTTINNTKLSVTDLKSGRGIGLLNSYASGSLLWRTYYLPASSGSENGGFPVLSHETTEDGYPISIPTATDINDYYNTVVWDGHPIATTLTKNAVYSTTQDPFPLISITNGGSANPSRRQELIQNADFYVLPAENTKNVVPSETPYEATIIGMGAYKEELEFDEPITYTIDKANISDCTVIAAQATFNWAVQKPAWVRLINPDGLEISTEEYTWDTLYDEWKDEPQDWTYDVTSKIYRFYDYMSTHGDTYKYDIKVSANQNSAYYKGTDTQATFRIMRKDMVRGDDDTAVKYDKVIWGDDDWDFDTALKDTSGDTIKIPYTGKPITPTVQHITYLGNELIDYYAPDRGPLTGNEYMYVYGNPNPEETGTLTSTEPINVTPPGEPSCMTVRYAYSSCNFSNFINVFFTIVQADIANVDAANIYDQPYTGNALEPDIVLTYNDITLEEGKDYELAYSDNTGVGKAEITVTGKGNFKGTKTVNFNIKAENLIIGSVTAEAPTASVDGEVKVEIDENNLKDVIDSTLSEAAAATKTPDTVKIKIVAPPAVVENPQSAEINKVELALTTGILDKIVATKDKVDAVVVNTELGDFEIPSGAFTTIKNAVNEENQTSPTKVTAVILSAAKAAAEEISQKQQAATADASALFAIDLKAGRTAVQLGSNIIKVSLPYKLKNGEKNVAVFHIADDGTAQRFPTAYDKNAEKASFSTNHFSLWAVKAVAEEIKPDTTAPKLSAGSITRTSATAAKVSFTTDKPGIAYYYAIGSGGASAPKNTAIISVGKSLGAVTVGRTANKAVSLTKGAKDIYIVIKDGVGNISAPLKIAAQAVTVTFNANGGKKISAKSVKAWDEIRLPKPSRAHYTFAGWYAGSKKIGNANAAYTVTASTTLTAKWTIAKQSVKLNANGGKISGKTTFTVKKNYNSKLGKLNTPTKKGYKFLGWYTKKKGGAKIKTASKVTKNITYYAHWKKK